MNECVVRLEGCRAMLARFRAAYDQLAAKKLLVMQLADRPLRFVDRLHLHKSKTL